MRILRLVVCLLLLGSPVYAQGVAVVQSAAPTINGGTQDFTVSGFGTAACAMFFLSYGTTNGTAATHAMVSVGFSDFTNHRGIGVSLESTGGATDTGAVRSIGGVISLLSLDQTQDGVATASTITDGVRLTWSDAPPSAYLVTAVMFNSTVFSNCAVGTLTLAGIVDTTTSVSGLGWQPDVILGLYAASTVNARVSWGAALNDGGVVQYSQALGATNANTTSDTYSRVVNNRISYNATELGADGEVTSFDSGGFTVTSRTGTSVVSDLYYLTAKLAPGMSAKLTTCSSPTVTGAHSCTGAGFTPQAAIMLHSNVTALNTASVSTTNSEIFGISAFTGSAAGSVMGWMDDNTATTGSESMADTKPVRLRKDSADYMTATLTGWQSDGADFNYTTTDSSARIRPILFFKAVSVRPMGRPIMFQ